MPVIPAAADTVMVYGSQNPDANEQNESFRLQRVQTGTILRDLLYQFVCPSTCTGGAWSNMLITPGTGLHVTVNQSPFNNQVSFLYQVAADSTTQIPVTYPGGYSGPQLPTDSTPIVIPYSLTSSSSPMAVPVPGAGDHVWYLIEATGTTAVGATQSQTFINSTGAGTSENVSTQQQDTVSFQAVEGTVVSSSANCPATTFADAADIPNPDSGYTSVGYVCVGHAASSISATNPCTSASSCIVMETSNNFNGTTFGKISFGGAYANTGAVAASVLTTSSVAAQCNIDNGEAFTINNPSASTAGNGHILRADLAGNLAICGSNLIIAASAANTIASIYVNTNLDHSSQQLDQLVPAAGSGTAVTSGSCATQTYCTIGSGLEFFCDQGGTFSSVGQNAAFVSFGNGAPDSTAYAGVILQVYDVTSGGFGVSLFNASSGSISNGTHIPITYVCL